MDLVLRYSSSLQKTDVHRIIITYTDEDGDIITISSDQELEDAFSQFVDKVPSVIRATVSMMDSSSSKKGAASTQPNEQQDKDSKVSNHVLEERICRLEEKVAKMWMNVHDSNDEKDNMDNQLHEQDGLQRDGDGAGKAVATKAVQVKPKAISKATGTDPQEASKKSKDEKRSNNVHDPKEVSLECFHPEFIHGRHTCDGCFTTPIVGYRFHAVNLPDYDLCYKCFKNYKGRGVFFQPEELERDRQLQNRWRMRTCKKNTQARAAVPAKKCNKRFQVNKVKEIAQDIYDAALNEAIRRSLIVEEKKEVAPELVEAPKDVVKEQVEMPLSVEKVGRMWRMFLSK
jgi:Zinc finger, ZZ type./PB1 domain.